MLNVKKLIYGMWDPIHAIQSSSFGEMKPLLEQQSVYDFNLQCNIDGTKYSWLLTQSIWHISVNLANIKPMIMIYGYFIQFSMAFIKMLW